jgi:hypothetical protein
MMASMLRLVPIAVAMFCRTDSSRMWLPRRASSLARALASTVVSQSDFSRTIRDITRMDTTWSPTPHGYVVTLYPTSAADLVNRPDDVQAWIRLDLLTRDILGQRMEHGSTPETDEALDKLMVFRAWSAERLVN